MTVVCGVRLALAAAKRDLSNFHLLHYRNADAFLVTAKNSGTHWLRFMLSRAIAYDYELPEPRYSSGAASTDFVGHPKYGQKHPHVPVIAASHNLPSRIFCVPQIHAGLKLPPIVVLVRDIEDAMLSHFVKWRNEKGFSLSEYLRTPAPGRKYVADVWWYIDFFNRWGAVMQNCPANVLLVRYEDIQAAPARWLARIFHHMDIGISREAVALAAKYAAREHVHAKLDPNFREVIVPDADARGAAAFDVRDRDYLMATPREHLRFTFGYALGEPEHGTALTYAGEAPASLRAPRSFRPTCGGFGKPSTSLHSAAPMPLPSGCP